MTDLPGASVVVLTYNSQDYILACLERLHADDSPGKELLVIDNASRDDTVNRVRERYPDVRLIVNPFNRGVAGGWNQGWLETRGELVVFLNPDIEVLPSWLRALQDAMRDHPDVDVAGIKLLYPGGRIIQHAGSHLRPNAQTWHRGEGEEDRGQFDVVQAIETVTGAVLCVRRSALERLGGFDEDYYPAYYEEADFCFRVWASGRSVYYVPTSVAYHHESVTLKRDSDSFLSLQFRMRALYLLKNLSFRQIFSSWLRDEARMHFRDRNWRHSRAAIASYFWVAPYAIQRHWRKITGRPGRPFDARLRDRPGPKTIPSSRLEEAAGGRGV